MTDTKTIFTNEWPERYECVIAHLENLGLRFKPKTPIDNDKNHYRVLHGDSSVFILKSGNFNINCSEADAKKIIKNLDLSYIDNFRDKKAKKLDNKRPYSFKQVSEENFLKILDCFLDNQLNLTTNIQHENYRKLENFEEEKLIDELENALAFKLPETFRYSGIPKEKSKPLEIEKYNIYPRDKKIALNALFSANYLCEIDLRHPTFIRKKSNRPYTEIHHLIPMAFSDLFENSLDIEENIVSLCSNCHNEIHYGKNAKSIIIDLYNRRIKLLKSVGLNISKENLLKLYGV